MVRRGLLLALALPLCGCDRLSQINSLVNPIVAQGIFVGLDVPSGVDLSESDLLAYTAACSVFLAYVSDPSELDQSPVEGAEVAFRSSANEGLDLSDEGGGKYLLSAEDGLAYTPDDDAVIMTVVDGEEARLEVHTPAAPDVDVPTTLQPQHGFTVDLTGQGYDNVLVAVYDISRGKVTYENLPTDILETYEFTHGEGSVIAEIPGDAFLRQSSYVVGIAGMEQADASSFEGVSQSLSAFMAGQFALRFIQVRD